MSAEIILIAGLPGSGKTTYMEARQQEGWSTFDDFKANAYNDSSAFRHSRNYEALLMALRQGEKCLVADIDFYKATLGMRPKRPFERRFRTSCLAGYSLKNDPHASQANIRRRASRSIEDNLRALQAYRAMYQIPIRRAGDPRLETRRILTSFVIGRSRGPRASRRKAEIRRKTRCLLAKSL